MPRRRSGRLIQSMVGGSGGGCGGGNSPRRPGRRHCRRWRRSVSSSISRRETRRRCLLSTGKRQHEGTRGLEAPGIGRGGYGRGTHPGGDDHAAIRCGFLRRRWWRHYAAQPRHRRPVIFPLRRGAVRGAAAGGRVGGGGNRVAALVCGGGRTRAWHALLPHRTPPPRRRASLVVALWAGDHWVAEGGMPTLSPPRAETSAAAPPDSALHDADWQPATAVAMSTSAALPARSAVGSAADRHTSPCLSATARAAAAATSATWPARGAAPAARPLVGTPPPACRQPARSMPPTFAPHQSPHA